MKPYVPYAAPRPRPAFASPYDRYVSHEWRLRVENTIAYDEYARWRAGFIAGAIKHSSFDLVDLSPEGGR